MPSLTSLSGPARSECYAAGPAGSAVQPSLTRWSGMLGGLNAVIKTGVLSSKRK